MPQASDPWSGGGLDFTLALVAFSAMTLLRCLPMSFSIAQCAQCFLASSGFFLRVTAVACLPDCSLVLRLCPSGAIVKYTTAYKIKLLKAHKPLNGAKVLIMQR